MLAVRPPFNTNLLKAIAAIFFIVAFASCTVVKKYQPGKPFVYKTNINLIGNFSSEEEKNLEAGLREQLDDSVQVRKVDNLIVSVLKSPPVYDSSNADKSIIFMRALLQSQGYFNDSIYYGHSIDTVKSDEYRTTVDFYVRPGNLFRLDTVIYNLNHPELQQLADSTKKDALVKKGDPFSKTLISAEFDRLMDLYRNNGYLRFNRDELIGLWDTLDISLLRPTLDPFEQIEILQKLNEKKERPTASLEIRLKSNDTSRLIKYYNGHVTVYPDYILDTIGLIRKVQIAGRDSITVIQHRNKFKAKIFPLNIYLPEDSLYQQRRYFRTLNRLNSLGAWRLISIDQAPRPGEDTVDFVIRLTAAKKYSFNTNLEGSINQSIISGNLFGIGLNVGWQNKNFARAANVTTTNVRYGVELGNNSGNKFIQSQQLSLSHNIYFPRAILPGVKFIPENWRDNIRTLLSTNIAKTERRFLYDLLTINGAWGYEIQRRNLLATIKFPNIEFSSLNKKDSLNTLIKNNPSLKNIFTDGLVVSFVGNLTITGGQKNRLHVLRVNFEAAPLVAGWFRSKFLDTQLYHFIKVDAEYAQLYRFRKSSVALRVFAGIGIADPFNSSHNPSKKDNLPFFKEYFSGGPNSMRAWALRRLGQGSTIKEFNGENGIPDRYGDVQLEANAEYRFPIARPFGVLVNGALFTDIGNVWFLKKALNRPPEEIFKFSRIGKDIAVGAGVGLRIDFSFFVLRFDYAYKVKDPSPSPSNMNLQNKWFGYKFFEGDQFQLGINYPFIF